MDLFCDRYFQGAIGLALRQCRRLASSCFFFVSFLTSSSAAYFCGYELPLTASVG
jgi:hypothetical protein